MNIVHVKKKASPFNAASVVKQWELTTVKASNPRHCQHNGISHAAFIRNFTHSVDSEVTMTRAGSQPVSFGFKYLSIYCKDRGYSCKLYVIMATNKTGTIHSAKTLYSANSNTAKINKNGHSKPTVLVVKPYCGKTKRKPQIKTDVTSNETPHAKRQKDAYIITAFSCL